MSESEHVATRFDGLTVAEIHTAVWREGNPDSSFMRGFMWSLVLSLTLWAAAISLAFSVFR